MSLRWTRSAYRDLTRIHEFLEPVDPAGALRAVRSVIARVRRIPRQPRLGERVPGFAGREVRRVQVGRYEVRYEVAESTVTVLRIFHVREQR